MACRDAEGGSAPAGERMIPTWWGFILLAAAAYRTWRLIGLDTITEPLRRRATGLPDSWEHGDELPKGYREWLAVFLQCPWCAGADIAIGWWLLWRFWPHLTTEATVPFALSAAVGLLGKTDG